MIVEFLCRYNAPLDDETIQLIDKELKAGRIINSDYDELSERTRLSKKYQCYEYGPFTFNLKDIKRFNHIDSKHTCIRFFDGEAANVKVSYETFQTIYTTMTGINIHKFGNADNEIVKNGE